MTTDVTTATLIMSASEIATRKSFAGSDNTLKYYIAQAGETTPQFSAASLGGAPGSWRRSVKPPLTSASTPISH